MLDPAAPRRLGRSDLSIAPVALGCWPIAGMTSSGVDDDSSLATLAACFDVGINHFDTAFAYGAEGESERLISKAIRGRRRQVVLATKGGLAWDDRRRQVRDARPETLRAQCETSLQRLQTDYVDLLYLHARDPATPVAESAGALAELQREGKALAIGASNLTLDELREFHAACPLTAFQPPYNMLQRQIEQDTLPWCRDNGIAVLVYWPLMKGLLAGKLPRDHVFDAGDGRVKYPMFQGREWEKNQDFVDSLRRIAQDAGCTVAQLAVHWTIRQPGITAALCGAKRPEQIRETAAAMHIGLNDRQWERLEDAIAARGPAAIRHPA